ncbi:putative ankyrin repeat protein RF_0381 [Liolophura sinensis]|uniref:putative ankyrin repeat protein RF_0381 n=1 Tax=Liolophura sinensis TaxID=3198878 RepID=UPI00315967E3
MSTVTTMDNTGGCFLSVSDERRKMAEIIKTVCLKEEETFCCLIQEADFRLLQMDMTWRSHDTFTRDGSPVYLRSALNDFEKIQNDDFEFDNNNGSEMYQNDLEICQNDLENCGNDLDPKVREPLLTDGCGIVHWIAACGTPVMFDQLLSRCPQVDMKNSRTRKSQLPPLVFAAEAGNLALVQILLNSGCEVNAVVSNFGQSTEEIIEPLLVHVLKNGVVSCPTVETLLQAGTFDLNAADSRGMTALRVAVTAGNLGYVTALLSAGANPNYSQITPQIDPVIFDAMSREYDDSETPRLRMVETLLAARADANWPHPIKHAPLYSAAMLDDPSIVELLLKFGADPDAKSGKTGAPIIYSSCRNSFRIVEMLVAAKADVNLVDGLGYSALHRAAGFGYEKTARILLRNPDCDLELRTSSHQATPLTHAAASNSLDVLRLLVAHPGCDVDAEDVMGNTALHYEAINGCVEGVLTLLDSGCDPDAKNVTGASPLWYAIYKERVAISKILLQRKVDLSVKSRGVQRGQGSRKYMVFNVYDRPQSLLWVAVERANSELVQLLINAGLNVHEERWIFTDFASTGNTDETLREYLTDLISQPADLTQLCKNFILKLSERNPNRLPEILTLPKSLQRFLTFF